MTRRPEIATIAMTFGLLISGTAAGQGYLYSPPFLATSEGHDLVPLFGYRPSMRYQMIDGELRGRGVTLKEVALRLNETTGQSPWQAIGRSFSSVVIRIADGDRKTYGKDFNGNLLSTPTIVFSGGVTWPTVDSPLTTRPAPWGGTNGAYRYPFASGWIYSGRTDIVTDWSFFGGTLSNNRVWGPFNPYYYHFDGFGAPTSVALSNTRGIPSTRLSNRSPGVTTRCNDSSFGIHDHGSYLLGDGWVYGAKPSNPALKNQLLLRSKSYLTAPNTPAIHGWSLAANELGVDLATGCNRLHVRGPLLLIPTRAVGRGITETPDILTPWQPVYANTRITMQAAWADSKTARLGLTQALQLRLPGHAPPNRLALRSCIIESDIATVQGPFTTGNHNPGLRYRY